MISTNFILVIELTTLIIACTYSDLKTRIIPNKITVTLALMGLLTRAILLKNQGLVEGIEGLLIAFVLLIVPYIIGGLGAGDIKMLMAVGAIGGVSFILFAIIWTALVGGIMSVFILIRGKRIKIGLKNIKNYLLNTLLIQNLVIIEQPEQAPNYFPYGVAICLGTILTMVNNICLTGCFLNL
ncbi:MAG: prepilin peptidase [Aminipila sp.]